MPGALSLSKGRLLHLATHCRGKKRPSTSISKQKERPDLNPSAQSPILLFDSGVGGLTVLAELRKPAAASAGHLRRRHGGPALWRDEERGGSGSARRRAARADGRTLQSAPDLHCLQHRQHDCTRHGARSAGNADRGHGTGHQASRQRSPRPGVRSACSAPRQPCARRYVDDLAAGSCRKARSCCAMAPTALSRWAKRSCAASEVTRGRCGEGCGLKGLGAAGARRREISTRLCSPARISPCSSRRTARSLRKGRALRPWGGRNRPADRRICCKGQRVSVLERRASPLTTGELEDFKRLSGAFAHYGTESRLCSNASKKLRNRSQRSRWQMRNSPLPMCTAAYSAADACGADDG